MTGNKFVVQPNYDITGSTAPPNSSRTVEVEAFHTEYLATGTPPLACDLCGEVFSTYFPQLILVMIPKGRESQTITLCSKCEAEVMSYLKGARNE